MEDSELKNIWHEYDRRMEEAKLLNLQSWALNMRWFEEMQIRKAQSSLHFLIRFKVRAVVLGILWVLFLSVLVYGNQLRNGFLTVSLGMIILFNLLATVVYIKHIVLIRRIDYSEPVTDTQERLAALQLSTLWIVRILWLQMPFYITWFWRRDWIDFGSLRFWLILFPITLFFILLAVFLYRNINIKNVDRKWVRKFLMAGPEYKSLVRAKKFVAEIEEFKKELVLNTVHSAG
ncbi:MAG TPA: hypothetical protein VGM24_10875 [Puia sp.]